MSNAKGVDVSHWQSTTPSLVGLDFLIARATYATTPDDRYLQHFIAADKASLVIGAFHFGVGAAQASIAAQVAAFLKAAGAADLLALDLESNAKDRPTMTPNEARAFLMSVKAADPKKRKIGLYHSASGYPSRGQDFRWIANWTPAPPAPPYDFWQYRGSPLDLDEFNGDRAALHAFVGLGSTPVPAPPPPNALTPAQILAAHLAHLAHVAHLANLAHVAHVAHLHALHVAHLLHIGRK